MQKKQLIQEMLVELSKTNKDIKSLRSRLEAGKLKDDQQILRNYRFLIQAIEHKAELEKMLVEEYSVEFSLVKLWEDVKKAN
ncbi:putative amino acid-binding ACT domain protein [Pedobacter sp. UYP24]